jgi:dihydrofolate synthase/folylpolyglutamate synthase
MTYPEALTYLGEARRFGMKLGLEPMHDLAHRLGDPHKKLRFIHIAGTNGKGSTAAFCESILRAAGFRVGLYTSPHLVSIRERIQIDRCPISEVDFATGVAIVRAEAEKSQGQALTFFEILTGVALWYFAREKVDWVVWETGLGGRLDATNIVTPQVCIITNIGLEHRKYLGNTLGEIAAEKAGIIKRRVPVVTAVKKGEASEVILEKIKKRKCLSSWIRPDQAVDIGIRGGKQWARIEQGYLEQEFALGLFGAHQVENAACAVAVMDQIRWGHAPDFNPPEHREITEASIARGLAETQWPGRFEILSEEPLMVLDGAHNVEGVKRLIETWREYLFAKSGWSEEEANGKAHLVLASVADKDISEMAQLLKPLVKEVSLVRLANERTADPAQLAEHFSGLHCAIYNSVAELWQKLEERKSASPILITGSLFLVGEMLARRQGDAGEYRLNERLEKK